jgi:protein-tyrosine-phosphatase
LAVIVFVVFLSLFLILSKLTKKKEKLLLYVSSGGTCRDPMAKAITLKVLEKKNLNFKLNVKAVGLGPLSNSGASYGARYVIKEMYHEDLLSSHRAERITTELIEQADLILVMDKSLLMTPKKIFPREKTFLFKSFFGLKGDIKDPYPDGRDQRAISRYVECANELKEILENNIDHLIKMLSI